MQTSLHRYIAFGKYTVEVVITSQVRKLEARYWLNFMPPRAKDRSSVRRAVQHELPTAHQRPQGATLDLIYLANVSHAPATN